MDARQLSSLIESLGATKVSEHTSELRACCPLCPDRNPSFAISTAKPGHPFNCFACGATGGVDRLVMLSQEMGDIRSARQYANRFGEVDFVDVEEEVLPVYERRFEEKRSIPHYEEEALEAYHTLNSLGRRYLRYRRVRYAVAKQAGVLMKDGNRLVFPWRKEGFLVGATSRAALKGKDPFRGIPVLDFTVRQRDTWYVAQLPGGARECIVVEGEIDALRVATAFSDFAVYASGSSSVKVSEDRIRQLSRFDRVYVLPDNDTVGWRFQDKLAEAVSGRVKLFGMGMPVSGYSDPAKAPDALLNKVFQGLEIL